MAKKDNKYNLHKKGDHSFDMSKGSKRHFDLSKDSDDMEKVVESQQTSTALNSNQQKPEDMSANLRAPKPQESRELSETSQKHDDGIIPPIHSEDEQVENIKKTNWWLYFLGGVVLVGLVIWLFCEMNWKGEHQGESEEEQMEQIASQEALEKQETSAPEVEAILPAEEVVAPTEGTSNVIGEEAQTAETMINKTTDDQSSQATSPVSQLQEQTAVPNQKVQQSTISNHAASVLTSDDVDVEAEAKNVIAGKYGNGNERKQKLGQHYRKIQKRVNEKKRNGEF